MKKDNKDYPKDIDKKSWDRMVEFTEGFGYMILYLSIFCIILLMIKDIIL
tara:strand:+ start:365 stop:514 length:150 start_codon:yes stop_codon:yes gene_type:complete